MPLWGANTNNESKPKNLTDEEKSRTFATERGWEITRPGHAGSEVLVAIRGLAGGATSSIKLGVATIDQVFFASTAYNTGATARVRVVWNERITPTTTGTLIIKQNNGTSISNITATRIGNTTSNFIDYAFTVGSSVGLVYTIPAQTITQGVNDFGQTGITSALIIVTSNVINVRALATGTNSSVTATA
jgi:hypothetical protein